MLRSLFLLLFLTLSLSALSNSAILKRANGFMQGNNKSNQFRAYNDYKNLYLRALMKDDKRLLKSSLKGIVKSGNSLHIDVEQYEKELSLLSKNSYKKQKNKKTIHKNIKKKKSKLKYTASNKLKSIRWKESKLVLYFSKKLKSNQINYFTKYDKNNKKYIYVFEVNAASLKASQTLHKKYIDKIKLSQHKLNTLRLSIENSKKVKINFKYSQNELIINIRVKSYKKVISTPHITAPIRLDRNKVIVIDAGHGGKDPGAVGYKRYREKVLVLQIAQKLKKILKKRGFNIYMTRDNDKFVKLSNRTKFANKKHADIFISIHANAVAAKNAKKAQGLETYFLSTSRSERAKRVAAKENKAELSEMDYYGKESFLHTLNSHNIIAANKLAIDLQRGALASLNKSYKKVKDAGVRDGPFWVLVGAQMPAVLVEVGFITHPTEAKRLVSNKYQNKLAFGLANGVERYFLNN